MKSLFLALALMFVASAAQAASFDCARARTPDEKLICADRGLSDQDVKLSVTYNLLLRFLPMGERGSMRDAQSYWVTERRRCGAERACISRAYARRQAFLDNIMEQRVISQGPF